jgi:hypothetical protein
VCSSLAAQSRSVVASTADCSRLSSVQRKWLSYDWQPFLDFTRACPIKDSKRETIILLVSAWASLYFEAQPGSTIPLVPLPHAMLFSPSGKVLGSLPYNFPDDPPAELRVTFTHWEDDFPQRVGLRLKDPRAAGPRPLPSLFWDRKQGTFVSKKEKTL